MFSIACNPQWVWILQSVAASVSAIMVFDACCLSQEEAEQKARSRKIDRQIAHEKVQYRRQVKVLLLGAGESGKSTFLKQMRIIHGQDFDNDALNEFRPIIYGNILKGMKVLADARRKLKLEWQDPSNQQHEERILNFQAPQQVLREKFMSYFESIKSLWMDKTIQDVHAGLQLVRMFICKHL